MENTNLIKSLDNKKNWKWVSMGLLTACDCFRCDRRIKHEIKKARILVYCKYPCEQTN